METGVVERPKLKMQTHINDYPESTKRESNCYLYSTFVKTFLVNIALNTLCTSNLFYCFIQ